MFLSKLAEDPAFYFMWIGIVAFSICVHEYAHAATAHRFGDDTAADQGHLSLNPLIQMGPMSLVVLCLIGIAWGMVPVNEGLLNKRQRITVSLAGPLSNLLLSAIFGALAVLVSQVTGSATESAELAVRFLGIGSLTNGTLFVLNVLPVPPLDGWHVARELFQPLRNISEAAIAQFSWILILLILVSPLFDFVWLGGELIARFFMGLVGSLIGLIT